MISELSSDIHPSGEFFLSSHQPFCLNKSRLESMNGGGKIVSGEIFKFFDYGAVWHDSA